MVFKGTSARSDASIRAIVEAYLVAGTNITLTPDGDTLIIATSAGGGGGTTVQAPQLFNPDSGEVTADTADFTLASTDSVAIVTLNGAVLDDSEYSLVSTTLTVTPDNGFYATTDEVLVFQQS